MVSFSSVFVLEPFLLTPHRIFSRLNRDKSKIKANCTLTLIHLISVQHDKKLFSLNSKRSTVFPSLSALHRKLSTFSPRFFLEKEVKVSTPKVNSLRSAESLPCVLDYKGIYHGPLPKSEFPGNYSLRCSEENSRKHF